MDADNVNVFFCAGTPDNISDIATHVDGGCVWLSYTGTSVGVDQICVSVCDNSLNICDTTRVIITVVPKDVIPTRDTIRVTVQTENSILVCYDLERGFGGNDITYTLCSGLPGGVSVYGTWVLLPNGCVLYNANDIVGRDVDEICVSACDASLGICDTQIIIVTIIPSKETIKDTIKVGDRDSVCVRLEPGMDADNISLFDCSSEINNITDIETHLDGSCIWVSYTGTSVGNDTICVQVCDEELGCTCTDTICLDNDFEPGVITTTTLCDGSTSESGTIANIEVLANGCVVVSGKNLVGRDTFCVTTCDAVTGICDTTIIVVVVPPTPDTIYEQVPTDSTITVCPSPLEPTFNATTTTYSFCDGSTGPKSGTFGDYTINTTTGCITYVAGSLTGKDTICVVACDSRLDMCDTTIIIITVVPNCPNVILDDTVRVLCDGTGNGKYCLPIGLTDILSKYSVFIDGDAFFDLPDICDLDTTGGYDFTTAIAGGQYGGNIHRLEKWTVNGTMYAPALLFNNLSELTAYMNVTNPSGDWQLVGDRIVGGDISSTYGNLQVFSPEVGARAFVAYNQNVDSKGTEFTLSEGGHVIVVENNETGCLDSVYVDVICLTNDTIRETVEVNQTITVCVELEGFDPATTTYSFCDSTTTPKAGTLGNYTINPATGCVTYVAGDVKGNEEPICVIACDAALGVCDTTIILITVVPGDTTIVIPVCDTCTTTICLDTLLDITDNVFTFCDGSSEITTPLGVVTIDAQGCISYTATGVIGIDTLCIEHCDTILDVCIKDTVIIRIIPTRDTIRDIIQVGDRDSVCVAIENGMDADDVTVVLCAGPLDNITNVQTHVDGGCVWLSYTGTSVGVDQLCVSICDNSLNICDTTVVIVTVIPNDTVIVVPVCDTCSETFCLDTLFDITNSTWTFCDGSTEITTPLGEVSIDGLTGCVTYTANGTIGFDTLCVIHCDTITGVCDTIDPIIKIVPTRDTIRDIITVGDRDSVCVAIENGMDADVISIELCSGPLDNITNVQTNVDGDCVWLSYTGTNIGRLIRFCIVICDNTLNVCDTTVVIITVLPIELTTDTIRVTVEEDGTVTACDVAFEHGVDGDNIVSSTLCDGTTSGTSIYGSYTADGNGCITYTANSIVGIDVDEICVVTTDIDGNMDTTIFIVSIIPLKDIIEEEVEVEDSIVICVDLPDGFSDPVITLCDGSTSGEGNFGDYYINSDGCLVYQAGTEIGKDSICVVACDGGLCDTTIVLIEVVESPLTIDTVRVELPITTKDTFCLVSELGEGLTWSFCDKTTQGTGTYGSYTITPDGCVIYTAGSNVGTDELCVVACNGRQCDTVILIVSVERPPIAVNDYGFTGGLPITIGVLSNDTLTDGDPLISGPVVISNPSHGTISVNTDGTITYTPTDLQYAGIDSLQYVICDIDGCDTAWVYISSCLIPQGISPNGDGDNDVLAINCIDDDNAELRVWNRWGAEVYRNQHYGVDGQLWGGTYQGEPLPDGTYYYCIKFNDVFGQSQVYSGFVVVHR
ncbi:MAG: gliding motility-associated C-terminal domain-containing protein [Bacteroidetes bacterium]|nr:gliding motility-associated C-terminal domain-containing protein [Bacteroidota bacterium]